MKKNLFEEHIKDEVVQRIERLTETGNAGWGVMNTTEMMHHLKHSLTLIIAAEPIRKNTSIKQILIKQLMLHVITKLPKGAKAPRLIDIKKSNIQTKDFFTEKEELTEKLNLFYKHQRFEALHPYFGRLNRKEWGILTWMHFDHHLRQFGV